MKQTIYKCRICGSLIRDNTDNAGGYFYTNEDLSVCQECRDKANPIIREEDK